MRLAADREPEDLVRRWPLLVIDEVQRAPQLLLAVKSAVDGERQRTKGRFVRPAPPMCSRRARSLIHSPAEQATSMLSPGEREVDFVIERGERVIAVDVEATMKPIADDWKHLKHFVREYGERCRGAMLLYGGEEMFRASERVLVVPWWRVM